MIIHAYYYKVSARYVDADDSRIFLTVSIVNLTAPAI